MKCKTTYLQLRSTLPFSWFWLVYPSLDASDDERDGKDSTKKRSGKVGRSRLDSGDESWNPRARVGPVVPKKDRPTRDGAKRPAVERVLEAAAQRRALEPVLLTNSLALVKAVVCDKPFVFFLAT